MIGPKPIALPLGDTPIKKKCDFTIFFTICQEFLKIYFLFKFHP
jgi:hypothetical protein